MEAHPANYQPPKSSEVTGTDHPPSCSLDIEKQKQEAERVIEVVDYSQRAQWLRAAVLGANDGLLSTASLMVGVGAVKKDMTTMALTGVAGLIAGACSMALGEFVSVYSQHDIELAQMIRENKGDEEKRERLPNPYHAAMASALAFAVGGLVPLLGAAFIENYKVRVGVVVGVVTVALMVFGSMAAILGKAPSVVKSCFRVLVGGWLAMAITFGLTKAVASRESSFRH